MTGRADAAQAGTPAAAEPPGAAPKLWRTTSEEETRRLGEALAAELLPDGILLLTGDLAAGKTVLAQGVAAGLGISPAEVQSPTFTLVREHAGPRGRLLHLDLYRLAPEDTAALGLEELLQARAVKVIEWAERLPFALPVARRLHLALVGPGQREIRDVTP